MLIKGFPGGFSECKQIRQGKKPYKEGEKKTEIHFERKPLEKRKVRSDKVDITPLKQDRLLVSSEQHVT